MTTTARREPLNDNAEGAREDLLRQIRALGASAEARLRPYVQRAPLTAVAQAAAVGFVLGLLVPARLQMVVVAPMLRAGMRRLVRSSGSGGLAPSPRPGAASTQKPSKENSA
jgi:hypothetical protein